MKRFVFVMLLLPFVAHFAAAQEYIVEITPTKKVIYVSRLGLSGNTSVEDVLKALPELMHRGSTLFYNFDIQYDGKSVGESRDAILVTTMIGELDKIEISTSSVDTQSKNGESGTINLVPRKLEKGLRGEAQLAATTEPDLMPNLRIGYAGDKFEILGQTSLEFYKPTQDKMFVEEIPNVVTTGMQSETEKYFQHTARVNMSYRFDDKNKLKAWLMESYSNTSNTTYKNQLVTTDGSLILGLGWYREQVIKDTSLSSSSGLMLNAMAEYEHRFNSDSKFVAYAGYVTSRNRNSSGLSVPNTFDGELKYDSFVIRKDEHTIKLKAGANMSYKNYRNELIHGSSLYLSPYFNVRYNFRGLNIDGTVRYQNFERDYAAIGGQPHKTTEHDFVANLNTFYQIKPHHAVRLILSRNLVRPSDMMLYPGLNFYPASDSWVMGTPDLKRAYIHSASFNYITDQHWDDNNIVINVGLGYNRADGLIEPVYETTTIADEGKIMYTRYINSGINDIGVLDLLCLYSHGNFTLSVGGNMFANFIKSGNGQDVNTFYNLSATPIFRFPHEWRLQGNVMYNSPVQRTESTQGDCLLASLKVSKDLGNWTLDFEFNDIFGYTSTDFSKTAAKTVYSSYNLYTRFAGIGVSYRFKAKPRK